jgi:LCP family protein required for cell wall assembly
MSKKDDFQNVRVNFADEEISGNIGKKSHSRLKTAIKKTIFVAAFILATMGVFVSQARISGQSSFSWLSKLPLIGRLVESAGRDLKGEENGRINILLLGMGGKNHDGGLLTDTIILASLDTVGKKVALFSIPRDLTVPLEGYGWKKINNVNAYAEMKSPGSGGLATSQAVSDILNIPIDYYVRADFDGFINIINELGGVNVYVENTLEDYRYPTMGKEDDSNYESRYEHLYIEKGWQEMDGKLALKYARSRHAAGAEGSDFARSRRQQKILEAVKEKAISKYVLFKPQMIGNIIGEVQNHISTNLKIWEIVRLWNMFGDIKNENIINKGLDNGPNGLLFDSISPEGAYILSPRGGDFSEIQYLVQNIFSDAPSQDKKQIITESASIEILNGTWVNGLASRVAMDLEKYGFDVLRVDNYKNREMKESAVYDLTYGEKINSISILKEKTNAKINFGLPEWLIKDLSEGLTDKEKVKQPDFILILGQNADTTSSGAENGN